MPKRIAIIQGHPDPRGNHYGHALADAYTKAAEESGHEVRRIDVASLDFPILRSKEDFDTGTPNDATRQAQDAIRWAGHLVIFYPLWLGEMPALLKAFMEQVFRPGFAFGEAESGKMMKKLLTGKSARIVVTMGMPAFFYRWYFRAHGLKNLQRNILGFSGIGPIKTSLIGMVEAGENTKRQQWIERMQAFGRAGK